MSATLAHLESRIRSASNLQSVISTMKSLAAVTMGRFDEASNTIEDYASNIELAMVAYGRIRDIKALLGQGREKESLAVIFATDLGMVGRFNETIVEYAIESANRKGTRYWLVGQRAIDALRERDLGAEKIYETPDSLQSLKSIITLIADELAGQKETGVTLFFNRSTAGINYEPSSTRILPIDQAFIERLETTRWPGSIKPQVIWNDSNLMTRLIREFLFVSLFRAGAHSAMAENGARLAYMEHAEKKIDENLEQLRLEHRRHRKNSINNELFDIIAGYEALRQDE